jgi:hypothetical protein
MVPEPGVAVAVAVIVRVLASVAPLSTGGLYDATSPACSIESVSVNGALLLLELLPLSVAAAVAP